MPTIGMEESVAIHSILGLMLILRSWQH